MKKIKIFPLFLILITTLSIFSVPALAVEDPEVSSNAIVLIESDTRTVLYTRNENVRVYPASTTKMMTVLLAIEAIEDGRVSLSDQVTATSNMTYDLISDGSSAGIFVGETMSLEDLLYCAMLSSGNDACNVIAEYIGGSIADFVVMMNVRAAELGCVGTNFANTHGLPNDNHYTTAWDFTLVTLEAITHSEFVTISDTVKYEVPETNMSERRYLSNSNGLINPDAPYYSGYEYEYAHGIKTGYTSAAGYCLVSTATKDGVDLLCVVMGGEYNSSGKYTNFSDSIELYDWGFANFSYQNILSTTEVVASVDVAYGDGRDDVSLKPQNNITAFLPNDTDISNFELEIKTEVGDDGKAVSAPIEQGQVLGEVKITLDGVSYGTVNLVSASAVAMSKGNYIKAEIAEFFSLLWVKIAIILFVAFAVLYLVSVIHYRQRRRRYVRYRRAKRESERAQQERIMQQIDDVPTGTSNRSQLNRERDIEEFFKK